MGTQIGDKYCLCFRKLRYPDAAFWAQWQMLVPCRRLAHPRAAVLVWAQDVCPKHAKRSHPRLKLRLSTLGNRRLGVVFVENSRAHCHLDIQRRRRYAIVSTIAAQLISQRVFYLAWVPIPLEHHQSVM